MLAIDGSMSGEWSLALFPYRASIALALAMALSRPRAARLYARHAARLATEAKRPDLTYRAHEILALL